MRSQALFGKCRNQKGPDMRDQISIVAGLVCCPEGCRQPTDCGREAHSDTAAKIITQLADTSVGATFQCTSCGAEHTRPTVPSCRQCGGTMEEAEKNMAEPA